MKKIFFSLLLTIFFLAAKSQLTKNNWLVGGTGSFYTYKDYFSSSTYTSEAKYTQIDISPLIGYFVVDKLAFGLQPTFSSIRGKVTTSGGLRTNVRRYLIGPFGRYYLLEKDKPFNILTHISYQYGIQTIDGEKEGTTNTFSALVGPVIYFNTSVGIEFLLGYNSSKVDVESAFKEIKKGFQIAVGFQIHLEK